MQKHHNRDRHPNMPGTSATTNHLQETKQFLEMENERTEIHWKNT